jgi:hypothetical protein
MPNATDVWCPKCVQWKAIERDKCISCGHVHLIARQAFSRCQACQHTERWHTVDGCRGKCRCTKFVWKQKRSRGER